MRKFTLLGLGFLASLSSFAASGDSTVLASYYDWDSDKQEWVLYGDYSETYDEQGRLITESEVEFIDETGTYEESELLEISYDPTTGRETRIESYFDTGLKKVVLDEKEVLEYDENGTRIYYAKYHWDQDTEEWIPFSKQEVTETLNIQYRWNTDLNDWVGFQKYVYWEAADGEYTAQEYYTWDNTANDWVGVTSKDYVYSADKDTLTYYEKKWVADSADFIQHKKNVTVYDADGNIVSLEIYNGFNYVTREYSPHVAREYTHDANGNVLTELYLKWERNPVTRQYEWTLSNKTVNTFDADNRKTSITKYYWDDTQWVGQTYDEYEFDAQGRKIYDLEQVWDATEGDWVNKQKEATTYAADGSSRVFERYKWDVTKSAWVGSRYNEDTYREDGKLIESLQKSWNSSLSEWFDTNLFQYERDENGNVLLSAQYTWSPPRNEWVGDRKTENEYDQYGNLISDIDYDFDGTEWVYISKTTYVYGYEDNSVSAIGDFGTNNGLSLYPNPTTEMVFFSLENYAGQLSLEVYDMQGQLVMQSAITEDGVNMSELTNGIYAYSLYVNGEKFSGKFCKQ